MIVQAPEGRDVGTPADSFKEGGTKRGILKVTESGFH
jgi:hypothetical protein